MCKATEILDTAMRGLISHACVPAVEALDDTHYTSASDARSRDVGVGGVISQKMGTICAPTTGGVGVGRDV